MIAAKAKKRAGRKPRRRVVSKKQLAANAAAKSAIEKVSAIPEAAAATDAEPTRHNEEILRKR